VCVATKSANPTQLCVLAKELITILNSDLHWVCSIQLHISLWERCTSHSVSHVLVYSATR